VGHLTRKQYPSGHRRISTALFLENVPRKRPYTVIEALLSIDLDRHLGREKSLRAYSRIFDRSRDWCRARIREYDGAEDALDNQKRSATLRPLVGHPSAINRPPISPELQDNSVGVGHESATYRPLIGHSSTTTLIRTRTEPEEEKKEAAADAASFSLDGGNGKVKPEKKARRGKKPEVPFPDPFPDADRQQVYHLARAAFAPEVCDYAIESTRIWAVTNQKRKADWPLTVWGAMRAGWALPKPGGPTGETDSERYARMAREMEEEQHGESR
jgi:hypothetical protein